MTQARFWHYHNGEAIRIKINTGQTLRHISGGRTDEGYSWEAYEWVFDGATVTLDYHSDGTDCDGRISYHGQSYCRADRLLAGYIDEEGFAFPAWEHGESQQRDYSAEAMNY